MYELMWMGIGIIAFVAVVCVMVMVYIVLHPFGPKGWAP